MLEHSMRSLPTLFLLAACTAGSGPPPEPGLDAPDPVTPSPAAPVAAPPPAAVAAPPPPPDDAPDPGDPPVSVRVVPDGPGMAVEITTDGWPGRAMEPALHVGQHRFDAYVHTSPVTLRFDVAEPDLLPQGAEARVQYGDDVVVSFVLPAPEAR